MTSLGVFLLSWFGGVLVASVVLGCVIAASRSAKIKFTSTVLIGAAWSSPFFALFLKISFEGTVLAIGPPFTRHRGNETAYAVLALLFGAVILWASIREARSGVVIPAAEEMTPNG
jgi:MFS-type transporter involved in bile tolerance (Atg22 family)